MYVIVHVVGVHLDTQPSLTYPAHIYNMWNVEYPEAGHVDEQILLGNIVSQVSHPIQPRLQELGNV